MSVEDLDRERRLRALDARMAAALDKVDAERFRALVEADMGKEVPTSVRLPDELIARLDALGATMSARPEVAALAGGTVSRSAVLRLAVLRGVEALEAEYEPASGKRGRGRK